MPDRLVPETALPPKTRGRILVIDDEVDIREGLEALLESEGYQVDLAGNAQEGVGRMLGSAYDLVLLDMMMPDRSGMDLLEEIRARDTETPVFLITAYGSIDVAIDALKRGATDYFSKPWNNEKLIREIDRVIGKRQLERENLQLKRALKQRSSFPNIVGKSERMLRVFDLVTQVAPSRATVLITGETGTGKELVARAIHKGSRRASGPFVRVACRAAASSDLERTLFGPEGRLAQAAGGTLFLDEVAELPLTLQGWLLEALEDPAARVIAATREPIEERTKQGSFREDFFFRLNVVPLFLPPLRERKGDIGPLAEHFARTIGAGMGKSLVVSPAAVAALTAYDWPGNVRELRNVVERACVLAEPRATLEREDLLFDFVLAPAPEEVSVFDEISAEEAQRVREALKSAGGNRARAARLLGIPRTTLNDRIKRLGII